MGVLLVSIKVALSSNKLLSLCSKLNDKLKGKEIIFLKNLLVYLLVTVATFEISLTQVLLESMKIALSSNKTVTYILVFEA